MEKNLGKRPKSPKDEPQELKRQKLNPEDEILIKLLDDHADVN